MSGFRFLTISNVLEVHTEQLDLYGGKSGLRDKLLLESALAAPQSGMDGEYFHTDIAAMAGAYLFHIVLNHPFIDGNKRTGLACAYLFLAINGYDLDCDPDELANMVLSVISGELNKEGIATFMRSHMINSPISSAHTRPTPPRASTPPETAETAPPGTTAPKRGWSGRRP